jgi:hypothetical protein
MPIRWTWILVAAVLAAGCGDGPTGPRQERTAAPTPAPTATPVPVPRISGIWQGKFKGLCAFDPADHSVRATLDQQGSTVTGTISDSWSSRCNLAGDFRGSLIGSQLTGGIGQSITVVGTASDTHMSWKVSGGYLLAATITFDR